MIHSLAVIGYGGIGVWHCANIREKLQGVIEIAGIYDIREERAAEAAGQGLRVYRSFEEVLLDRSVELVLLAVPNDLHKPMAIRALRAGKHVITEKPAALSSADFEEMNAVAVETGRLLTVHQNRRWDRDFLMVKQVYDAGLIGQVYMLESRVQGSRQVLNGWRGAKINGGGMVYDWGVHLLDQYLMLIDSPVTEVYANLFSLFSKEVDDNFKAILRFENGVSALVEVSMNCFILHPRWHVCGLNGTMQIDDWDCEGRIVRLSDKAELEWDEVIVYTEAGPTRSMAPRPSETVDIAPLPEVKADWSEYYRNIADALEGKAELKVKPKEVVRVLKVMGAIFESGRTGQSVKCYI